MTKSLYISETDIQDHAENNARIQARVVELLQQSVYLQKVGQAVTIDPLVLDWVVQHILTGMRHWYLYPLQGDEGIRVEWLNIGGWYVSVDFQNNFGYMRIHASTLTDNEIQYFLQRHSTIEVACDGWYILLHQLLSTLSMVPHVNSR